MVLVYFWMCVVCMCVVAFDGIAPTRTLARLFLALPALFV